ncbi:TPA: YcaO-like family protein, partial [Streptococcus suis]|nr:YcaO-like family protein [Streptococcus suis]
VLHDYNKIDDIIQLFNSVENEKQVYEFYIIETYENIYYVKGPQATSAIKRIRENVPYYLLEIFSDDYGIVSYPSYFDKNDIKTYIEGIYNFDFPLVYRKNSNRFDCINLVLYPTKKTVRFSEVILLDESYVAGDTRVKSDRDSDVVLNSIGELSPIYDIEKLDEFSDLGYPVYKTYSSRGAFENIFSVHGGKGMTDFQSKCSALGEAYERYSARLFEYDEQKIICGSFTSMKQRNRVLHPESLVLDVDYNNIFSEKKIFEWVEAYSLTNEKMIYVPANSVFFPYDRDNKLMLHSQSTTGISAEVSTSRAILQALLEILERDSYSIVHKALLSVKEIDENTIKDEKILNTINYLKVRNIRVHLSLISQFDFVYVVHCTLESETFPIFTHGSGANLNINIAIKRAIFEAIQMRVSQIELKSNGDSLLKETPFIKWGEGEEEFVKPFLTKFSSEVIDVSKVIDFSTGNIKTDIEFLVSKLKSNNFEVICVNLSRDDVPLSCVRVIVPGLQDIDNFNGRVTPRLAKILKEQNRQLNCIELFS